MSSVLFSIPSAAAPASPATANASSAASSSGRGREAPSPTDADGFGAALARSRDARPRQAQDNASTESSNAPATHGRRRTLASDAQREEASPAELLAMAMLTPAFNTQAAQSQQLRGAGGQAGELAARTTVEPAATGEPLAAADAADAPTDARATATASSAAAQAAGTQAAEEPHADTKDDAQAKAKAKVETPAAASDAKAPVAALPNGATTPVPGAAASAAPASSGAVAATPGNAAKGSANATAISLQASEAAPAEHQPDTASDTPTLPPGMLNFRTALGEATNVQTATAAQAQTVPRFNVPTPVGSEGWGADIGTQMIRMGADGHHVAELSLNPAGLGPLKVTLTLGDNQAQAMFVSAHESVRRAVEAALPQLRDTLAGQGIQLGQASVDAGTQQQQQAFGQERGFEAPARLGSRGPQQATAVEAEPARTATRSRASSGIDTFA